MPNLAQYLPKANFLSNLDLWIVLFYAVSIFVLAQVVGRRKSSEEVSTKGYFLANVATVLALAVGAAATWITAMALVEAYGIGPDNFGQAVQAA